MSISLAINLSNIYEIYYTLARNLFDDHFEKRKTLEEIEWKEAKVLLQNILVNNIICKIMKSKKKWNAPPQMDN